MQALRIHRYLMPGAVILTTVRCGGELITPPVTPPVPVAAVAVTPGLETIYQGDTVRFFATLRDAQGNELTGRTVSWSTNNSAVATVAGSLVTGRAAGWAIVTATAEGKAGSSVVAVRLRVAAVAVTPGMDTVSDGDTVRFVATLRDAQGNALTGRTVTWSTSDTAIAAVAGGLVTGRAAGSATVTASAEGKAGSSVVAVRARVANVRVEPGAAAIVQGDTVRFVATPMDAEFNALSGRTISWSISDSGIATVKGGLVTGRAVGQALVIATAEGQAGSSSVTVTRRQPIIFASVSAGGVHTCGLSQDAVAYCWGYNGWGQLGDGIFGSTRTIPTPVTGGYRFASLAPGDYFTCGITVSGIALCWGGNMHGELGFDPSGALCFDACPQPTPVSGNIPFASLTGGWEHTCGLTAASDAYCWGLSYWNEASREATESFSPVAVPGGLRFALLTAGVYYTCGLTPSGVAHCWGRNDRGQLGDGSTTDRRNPTAVSGGLTFATLSPHPIAQHTCGVTPAGSAYCWGPNGDGQLGDGSTVASSNPVAVRGSLTFATLAAGWAHTCGLTTAGAAYCWGSNTYGQLGVGSTTPSVTPVAVAGGLTFVTLSAGWGHTCGLASDGIVHCWGVNHFGQLGNGATTNSLVPVPVSPPFTASWAGTAGGGSTTGEVRLRRPSSVGGHARGRRGP